MAAAAPLRHNRLENKDGERPPMRKFEVALYNEEVRRLVSAGERHRHLEDSWGDTHYIEVTAADEQDARAKVARRYPREAGYVVEQVVRATD